MGAYYHTLTNTGTVAAVVTGVYALDWMETPFEATVVMRVPSGSTMAAGGTVSVTPEDVNAATATSFSVKAYAPALVGQTTNWFPVPGTATATGGFWNINEVSNSSTAYPLPARFVQVSSGSLNAGSSAIVEIIQSDNQRAG